MTTNEPEAPETHPSASTETPQGQPTPPPAAEPVLPAGESVSTPPTPEADPEIAPAAVKQPEPASTSKPPAQTAAQTKKATPAKALNEKPAPRKKVSQWPGMRLLVLEILLPIVLSAAAVWGLFTGLNIWQLEPSSAPILFSVAVAAIALFFSLLIDSLLAPIRKRSRARGVKFGSGPRLRLLKIALGGLIIPIGLAAAVHFVHLPARGTVIAELSSISQRPVITAPPAEVGSFAQQSRNPATQILSIQVLRGFHSDEAFAQLIQLAGPNSPALENAAVAHELSLAIANYGAAAKAPLLEIFRSIDPAQSTANGSTTDWYARYFAQAFANLSAEIRANTSADEDLTAKMAQIKAAQTQVKTSLGEIEAPPNPPTYDGARLDFILQTFQFMDLTQEPDLLAFAKTTAADARYSPAIRGDALLLIGKFGSADDLTVLFPYLKTDDSLLQTRALQAMLAIQGKLNKVAAPTPPPQNPLLPSP